MVYFSDLAIIFEKAPTAFTAAGPEEVDCRGTRLTERAEMIEDTQLSGTVTIL